MGQKLYKGRIKIVQDTLEAASFVPYGDVCGCLRAEPSFPDQLCGPRTSCFHVHARTRDDPQTDVRHRADVVPQHAVLFPFRKVLEFHLRHMLLIFLGLHPLLDISICVIVLAIAFLDDSIMDRAFMSPLRSCAAARLYNSPVLLLRTRDVME